MSPSSLKRWNKINPNIRKNVAMLECKLPLVWVVVAFCILISDVQHSFAGSIKAAVSSNFLAPMAKIAIEFEKESGNKVLISSGSTGQLYAQIIHGAPFDIFFAGDAARPEKLVGLGVAYGDSKSYAFGKLALLCVAKEIECTLDSIKQGKFKKLALANPLLAPYGVAAKQVLQVVGKRKAHFNRLVYGQNISQTMQFVISGTVEAGFVAVSDLKKVERTLPSSFLMVDSQFYDPIDQQMVVIKNQKNIIEARALANFVTSKKGRAIIKSFGYDLPKQKLLK